MKFSELKAKWPALAVVDTGGGCEAYRLDDVANDRYFLITGAENDDGDEAYPPDDDATHLTLGAYNIDDEDDDWSIGTSLTVDAVDVVFRDAVAGRPAFWVTEAHRLVPRNEPDPTTTLATSVADCFENVFGRRPARPELGALPIRSRCGADCECAIAAGHELIRHVRAAGGEDPKIEADIAAIVEAVINIYDAG